MTLLKVILLLGAMAPSMFAGLTGVNVNETIETAFNNMQAFLVSGTGSFASPGFTNFSDGTWTDDNQNNRYITASGDMLTSLSFKMTINVSSPAVVDLYVFNGPTIVDEVKINWNGTSWTYSALSAATYQTDLATYGTGVPEPSSLGLGCFGVLITLSMAAWRHKRQLRLQRIE